MDLKNPRQDSANFSHNNDCADVSTQKNVNKKKLLKIFGAGSLAFFMGVGTLCGVLLAPMNSAQANTSTRDTSQTLSAEEKLATGVGLGLDSQNDPILYTTESGLDIRFGGATLEEGVLKGYTYFEMGTYNGSTVKWVIVGRHSQGFDGEGSSLASYFAGASTTNTALQTWIDNFFEIETPAGNALLEDNIVYDHIYTGTSLSLSSKEATNETIDQELNRGEVLVISEYHMGYSRFGNSSTLTGYEADGCELRTYIENLYSSGLGLTENQKLAMVPKTLKTSSYTTSSTAFISTVVDARMFPLASNNYRPEHDQNFCYQTYKLSSYQTYPTSYTYWTRSMVNNGQGIYFFSTSFNHNTTVTTSTHVVRPAFVLKI